MIFILELFATGLRVLQAVNDLLDMLFSCWFILVAKAGSLRQRGRRASGLRCEILLPFLQHRQPHC